MEEAYGRIVRREVELHSWLAPVLAPPSPHLDQCRPRQDRILRIAMLLEDIDAVEDTEQCDATEYHHSEYGR